MITKQTLSIKTKAQSYSLRHQVVIVLGILLLVGSLLIPRIINAQSEWQEIESLRRENQQNRSAIARLQNEATSYRDAITTLQSEIEILQIQIDINTAEQNRLSGEIKTTEAELATQRTLLGKNIRAMYIEGEMSTIEILASSKDLSDFVDKQQYRNSVKKKISTTVDKINTLRHELRGQRELVEKLLKQQNEQRVELANNRSEFSRLLSYNSAQQEEFNRRTRANQNRIDELIALQLTANDSPGKLTFIRIPGNVGGHDINVDNYPYKGYGHSQKDEPCIGPPATADSPDRWGYCTRQCTSYVAWAIERSGRSAPVGWGHAKKWITNAPQSWIVGSPQPGDIAVSTLGHWGHVMYVERVEGSKVLVSEYNQQLTGGYRSDRWLNIY